MRLALLLLTLGGCAGSVLDEVFGADGRTLRQEIATFPAEHREGFALAEQRCGRCHSLDVPFAAHVPEGSWRSVVRTMQRRPGAVIPDADADRIASFFEYLDGRRRAAGRN